VFGVENVSKQVSCQAVTHHMAGANSVVAISGLVRSHRLSRLY